MCTIVVQHITISLSARMLSRVKGPQAVQNYEKQTSGPSSVEQCSAADESFTPTTS